MSIRSGLPPWPSSNPEYGGIRLRKFTKLDAGMAMDLSQDPYVATVGSLPLHATHEEALAWIERQQQRHVEGTGFSFSIADAETDRSVGNIGLWIQGLETGRARIGYGVAPGSRGRRVASDALCVLTTFAWAIPQLHRLELYIEPWNTASIRTGERAGFEREGLLRSHEEIGGERRDMFLYAAIRESGVR